MSEYTKQAIDFADKHGIKLTVLNESYGKYFDSDRQSRSIFKLRLERNKKRYTFTFGQSIANAGIEPNMYDVLACLTKHDAGSFEGFCSDFGYDDDSRATERIYKNVVKEYAAVQRLFGDIVEDLREIE